MGLWRGWMPDRLRGGTREPETRVICGVMLQRSSGSDGSRRSLPVFMRALKGMEYPVCRNREQGAEPARHATAIEETS